MPPRYAPFDAGLDVPTKFLTERLAYFLGGLIVSNESVDYGGDKYWIVPCTYNSAKGVKAQIARHQELVSEIGEKLGAETVTNRLVHKTDFDSGKMRKLSGFRTFFRSTGLQNVESLCSEPLRRALQSSSFPWSVRRAFVVGIYDGRGSLDVNRENGGIRYIAVDCPSDAAEDFLTVILRGEGLDPKRNPERVRGEGNGAPRNPQLRLGKEDVSMFLSRYGLVSPIKLERFEEVMGDVTTMDCSDVLPGLKTMTIRAE